MRREDQLAQPAAEIRKVGALSGGGQEHLPDHLIYVGLVSGLGRLAGGGVDAKRKGVVGAVHGILLLARYQRLCRGNQRDALYGLVGGDARSEERRVGKAVSA